MSKHFAYEGSSESLEESLDFLERKYLRSRDCEDHLSHYNPDSYLRSRCSHLTTCSSLPKRSRRHRHHDPHNLKQELEHMKMLYIDKTEHMLHLEVLFQRALNHLNLELESIDEKRNRMNILEAKIAEKLEISRAPNLHGFTSAFATQPRGASRSPGDFSFSNNEGDETTNFSFGEIDENIEVHLPYNPDAIEFERFLKKQERSMPSSVQSDGLEDHEQLYIPYIYHPTKTGYEDFQSFPLSVGQVIAERYKVECIIASTNFSTVAECHDMFQRKQVCLKIINNQKETFDQGLDEIKIIKSLDKICNGDLAAKYIVKMLDFFYFRHCLFLVYEILGENLFVINSHSELSFMLQGDNLKRIVKQILTALDFIHSQGIIHADIKPENILLTKKIRKQSNYKPRIEIRIVDFGSSCFITDELTTYIQSKAYRSPEVMLGAAYDTKIDMWSLGCVIGEILNGDILFMADDIPETLYKIKLCTGEIPKEGKLADLYVNEDGTLKDDNFPSNIKTLKELALGDHLLYDFLKLLLRIDPTNRPSASEALAHPWLN